MITDKLEKTFKKTKVCQSRYTSGRNTEHFSRATRGLTVEHRNKFTKKDTLATIVNVMELFQEVTIVNSTEKL